MTCRDTITRRRAKGLWTGRFWIELGHADSVRQEWRPARPGLGSGYKSRGLAPRDEGTASTSGLKPYWGKPAVRNFREGRGNGAASAAIAPLLYSTAIVDNSICERAHMGRGEEELATDKHCSTQILRRRCAGWVRMSKVVGKVNHRRTKVRKFDAHLWTGIAYLSGRSSGIRLRKNAAGLRPGGKKTGPP